MALLLQGMQALLLQYMQALLLQGMQALLLQGMQALDDFDYFWTNQECRSHPGVPFNIVFITNKKVDIYTFWVTKLLKFHITIVTAVIAWN